MHDVVAHSLSVIVVQADGGRYAAQADPEAAGRALDTIADTARRALADCRRVLGLLHGGDESPQLSPVAEVEAIGALVEQVRALGLDLAHVRTGSPRPLPPGPGMAVYRVCQESLTNVIKHAGPTARATVSESWLPDRLRLVVSNTLSADRATDDPAPTAFPGQGIVGMRERAEVFGGRLTVGRTGEGGFRVQLDLPYPDQDAWPGPGRTEGDGS
jgi:signal transduction histidine kinase